jgi:hypothetical protein
VTPCFLSSRARPWALACCLILGAAAVQAGPNTAPPAAASATPWQSLTPAQKADLAPLANDWNQLSPGSRQKWLEIADRSARMPPAQRALLHQRMAEWARLTPNERSEARINFRQTRQNPGADKQAEWEAYRALPAAEQKALAARAKPVGSGNKLRATPLDAQTPKSNVISGQAVNSGPAKPVSAAVVQGGAGATTTLVTARPSPPAHQQAGLPKISAGPSMVDAATLLPKRGPQAAGARPIPGAPVAAPVIQPEARPRPASAVPVAADKP